MVIETLGNAVAVGFWLRQVAGTVTMTLALNGTSQLAGSFSQISRNQEKLVVLPAVDPGVNTITLTFTGGTLLEVRRIRCRELPHRELKSPNNGAHRLTVSSRADCFARCYCLQAVVAIAWGKRLEPCWPPVRKIVTLKA